MAKEEEVAVEEEVAKEEVAVEEEVAKEEVMSALDGEVAVEEDPDEP